MSTNHKFVFTFKTTKTLSLKAVVLTPLIYVFGSMVFGGVAGFTLLFWSVELGIPPEKVIPSGVIQCAEILFFLFITVFLLKRYSGYFFAGSWKINFYSNLKTGLKWSIPFIILTGIGVLFPEQRAEWLEHYFLENNLSQENITIIPVILISASLLIASFLEELIFRGMIQQSLKKYVNPKISVLITAVIFTLAHFGHFFFISVSLVAAGYLFTAGIFTGFAFNKANSCIASFIPHLLFNIKYIVIVPLILAL